MPATSLKEVRLDGDDDLTSNTPLLLLLLLLPASKKEEEEEEEEEAGTFFPLYTVMDAVASSVKGVPKRKVVDSVFECVTRSALSRLPVVPANW